MIILTRQTSSSHTFWTTLPAALIQIFRLRQKLSSVRLSKLNKAPVLEGKPMDGPKGLKNSPDHYHSDRPLQTRRQCRILRTYSDSFPHSLLSLRLILSCGLEGAVFAFSSCCDLTIPLKDLISF